ncbi:hypothetical protein LMIY3S_01894 [Labrys miyagiensis]
MPLRCIFVPTGPGVDPERRLEAAMRLARHTHAHIETVFISPAGDPGSPSLVRMGGTGIHSEVATPAEMKALTAAGRTAFEHWCSKAHVPLQSAQRLDSTFASWREESGDVETIVALTGRVNDLVVIDNPTHASPFEQAVFDAAVFSTGRPTLILGNKLADNPLRHVVIAWNGSLEGARAVGQSIALLHEAERISIVSIPSERQREAGIADLGSYLHWHGVVVEPAALVPDVDGSAGERILAACKSAGATMLVMGAYTHSRLRQAFLGGVTQHILENAAIPVLMAH